MEILKNSLNIIKSIYVGKKISPENLEIIF